MSGNKARIGARIDGDESGLKSAFGRAGTAASAFAAKMRGIGKGMGVAFTGAAVLAAGKAIANNADRIADLAANVTMTTDELQAFEAVARESGASSDKLASSLEKLKTVQGNLATGENKDAMQALEALGVSAEDAQGPVAELFMKIAKGFAQTGNVGALDNLFGKGSVQLANTLKTTGSFGSTDQLVEMMRQSGAILSAGELSNLATLNDKAAAMATKASARVAATFTPGAEDQTAIEQQREAIRADAANRRRIAEQTAATAQAEKRAELEKIISGAKGDTGIGSELVRIGARGGISGGESPAVKVAKDQLVALNKVVTNTDAIKDIETGTLQAP